MKLTKIILLAVVVSAILAGTVLYPLLPERMASHWNAAGVADGYMGKFWGVFLIPIVMIIMFGLYLFIPKADPLKANIESFRKYYDAFWIVFFVFFLYVFGLTLAWNSGYRFDFSRAMILAFPVLWFFLGILLEKSKRNWFIGIRTPWTMASDAVWDETHRLGGKLFKAVAVVSLVGLFFRGGVAIALLVIPAGVTAVIAAIYSYFVYKRLNKNA